MAARDPIQNEVDFIGPHMRDCIVALQRAGCPIGGDCCCALILHPDRGWTWSTRPLGTPIRTFRASFVGSVIR